MARFDGSLALKLDFGEMTTTTLNTRAANRGGLHLALPSRLERLPDKYRALDTRRRQAQIQARRLLDQID